MTPYRPDKFTQTYRHFNGDDLWQWLHRDHIIMTMETASYLHRPAIEALSPFLREKFSDELVSLKFRQMVGHMARQVLEARGYHLDRANVRTTGGDCVFGWGAVYKRLQTKRRRLINSHAAV